MKKAMKTFLAGIIFISAMQAQENTTTVTLDGFTEIKAYDQINVTLIQGDKNYAVVSGDDQEKVSLNNKDGLLKVAMETDNFLDGNKTYVTLYHKEDLRLVDANEGATISSEKPLDAVFLTLRSQEGAKINVAVATRNLNAKAVTGGEVEVTGSAKNQEINIRSGGDYNGQDLASEQSEVTVFAGGNAIVKSSKFVDANVTAGGTIEIYGNPETVKEDKTLGGQIVVR
ncbi:head GIN domain-containing protein [Maribacter sp. 2-571]|uniref:head GIN domain-containing protein n=1 Tax=Maribacter sp. 2-571 TaxID=3417569 RepID=UPI003D3297F4